MHHSSHIFAILIFFLSCAISSAQQLITAVSSAKLVQNEQSLVYFVVKGGQLTERPPQIFVSKANFRYIGHEATRRNRVVEHCYIYQFSAPLAGSYEIPAIDLVVNGQPMRSQAATIEVLPTSALKKQQARIGDYPIELYTLLTTEKEQSYPGEPNAIELKVYFPALKNVRISLWDLPKGKKINCTSWRYEQPENKGHAIIENKQYLVGSYRTTLQGIEAGRAGFSEQTVRMVLGVPDSGTRGFFLKQVNIDLHIAPLEIEITPFPSPQPEGFDGAVGTFSMDASINAKETLSSADSIDAKVTISGYGNLNDFPAPQLHEAKGWKLITATRSDRGDERKSSRGSTDFTYLIQPTENSQQTPGFKFVYFDPTLKSYQTLIHGGKAVTTHIIPPLRNDDAAADNNASSQLTDILGPLAITRTNAPAWCDDLPIWLWQVIPASVLLFFVLSKIRSMRNAQSASKLRAKQKQKEWQTLKDSDADFLKAAGNFITRWHDSSTPLHADLQMIIEARDTQCYVPENKRPSISSQQKRAWLAILKKQLLTLSLLLALPTSATQVKAQSSGQGIAQSSDPYQLWLDHDYAAALKTYQEQENTHPADRHYNIGTCYYKLNQPGKAALHFQKAIASDPQHHEAQHNLDFFEQHFNTITAPKLRPLDTWIAKLSIPCYRQILCGMLWLGLLSFVYLKMKHPRNASLLITLLLFITALVGTAASIYCLYHHPKSAETQADPAVVLSVTTLYTEPSSTSSSILSIPETTPCTLIAERGEYVYIELPDHTRGWVSAQSIGKIHDPAQSGF